jgi:hypothetical protein
MQEPRRVRIPADDPDDLQYKRRWHGAFPVILQVAGGYFAVMMTSYIDTTTVVAVDPMVMTVLSWVVAVQGLWALVTGLILINDTTGKITRRYPLLGAAVACACSTANVAISMLNMNSFDPTTAPAAVFLLRDYAWWSVALCCLGLNLWCGFTHTHTNTHTVSCIPFLSTYMLSFPPFTHFLLPKNQVHVEIHRGPRNRSGQLVSLVGHAKVFGSRL